MTEFNYIGVATKSPRFVVNGKTVLVTGRDLIQQSLERIVGEEYGTRFFNPSFGSRLNTLLFEQNTEVIVDLLRVFVFQAIQKWEGRVEVSNVNITQDVNATMAEATVRILASNEVHTFVFPVYKKLIY